MDRPVKYMLYDNHIFYNIMLRNANTELTINMYVVNMYLIINLEEKRGDECQNNHRFPTRWTKAFGTLVTKTGWLYKTAQPVTGCNSRRLRSAINVVQGLIWNGNR